MLERVRGSHRILAPILVGVGVFLLAVAILLPLYSMPKTKKAPLDMQFTTVSEGRGTVLDITDADAENVVDAISANVPIRTQSYTTVEEPSDAEKMTLQTGFTAARTDREGDAGLITGSIDRVTVDRVTGMPVGDPVAQLQAVRGQPAVELPRDGLQYVFPIDAEQKSYPYYDLTARASAPIEFVEETTIDGLPVYHYSQEIGPVDLVRATRDASLRLGMTREQWGIESPEGSDPNEIVLMSRYYRNTRDVFVDPASGTIVDMAERPHIYYGTRPDDQAVTYLAYQTEYTDDTVASRVADARRIAEHVEGTWHLGSLKLGQPLLIAAFLLIGLLGILTAAFGVLLGISGERAAAAGEGPYDSDEPPYAEDPDDSPYTTVPPEEASNEPTLRLNKFD
jgi:hypothetical protein